MATPLRNVPRQPYREGRHPEPEGGEEEVILGSWFGVDCRS